MSFPIVTQLAPVRDFLTRVWNDATPDPARQHPWRGLRNELRGIMREAGAANRATGNAIRDDVRQMFTDWNFTPPPLYNALPQPSDYARPVLDLTQPADPHAMQPAATPEAELWGRPLPTTAIRQAAGSTQLPTADHFDVLNQAAGIPQPDALTGLAQLAPTTVDEYLARRRQSPAWRAAQERVNAGIDKALADHDAYMARERHRIDAGTPTTYGFRGDSPLAGMRPNHMNNPEALQARQQIGQEVAAAEQRARRYLGEPDRTGLADRMARLDAIRAAQNAAPAANPLPTAPAPAQVAQARQAVDTMNAQTMLALPNGGRGIPLTGPIRQTPGYDQYLDMQRQVAGLGMNRPELRDAGINPPALVGSSYYNDKGGAAAYGQQIRANMKAIRDAKEASEQARLQQLADAQAPFNNLRAVAQIFGQPAGAALIGGILDAQNRQAQQAGETGVVMDVKRAEAFAAAYAAIQAANPDLPREQAMQQAREQVEAQFGGAIPAAPPAPPAQPGMFGNIWNWLTPRGIYPFNQWQSQ